MYTEFTVTDMNSVTRQVVVPEMDAYRADMLYESIGEEYLDCAYRCVNERGRGRWEVFVPLLREQPVYVTLLLNYSLRNATVDGGKLFRTVSENFTVDARDQLLSLILCKELFPMYEYLSKGDK